MDYLLLNGKKVCAIKIKARGGRTCPDASSAGYFPKIINFWCSKRPLPQHSYEIKFSGAGVAPLNIKAVGEPARDNYDVYAEVAGPTGTAKSEKTPNARKGLIHFVVKWPTGAFPGQYIGGIDSAIRLFAERLRLVPPSERDLASAHFDAELRAPHGGIRRIRLAIWTGKQPLGSFFQAARVAWKRHLKE
jgi:hypothetical protein